MEVDDGDAGDSVRGGGDCGGECCGDDTGDCGDSDIWGE